MDSSAIERDSGGSCGTESSINADGKIFNDGTEARSTAATGESKLALSSAAATGRWITVEPVFFLYMFALNLSSPAGTQLAYLKYCRRLHGAAQNATAAELCRNLTFAGSGATGAEAAAKPVDAELQANSAHLTLYTVACLTVPMLIVCTFLGTWSDLRSRKWPQLVPLIGAAVAGGFGVYLAQDLDGTPPLLYLAYGLLQGTGGYFAGIILTGFSYLSAVVPPERLTTRVAVAEAVTALGLLSGTLLSGVVIDHLGLVWVYVITASAHAIGALYVALWLPDVTAGPSAAAVAAAVASKAKAVLEAEEKAKATVAAEGEEEAETAASCGRIWSCRSVADYLRCVAKRRPGYNRLYLYLALGAFFLGFCTTAGAAQVLFLFLTKVHGFSATEFGLFNGLDVLLKVTLGSAVMAAVRRWLRFDELAVAMLGCAGGVFGYGLIAVARSSKWMLWLAPIINSLGFFYGVALRSYVSRLVPADEQGRVFAFMGTGQSVFTLASSVAFNVVYPLSLHFYAGLCFAIAAALSGAAFALTALLSAHVRRHSPPPKGDYDNDDNDSVVDGGRASAVTTASATVGVVAGHGDEEY